MDKYRYRYSLPVSDFNIHKRPRGKKKGEFYSQWFGRILGFSPFFCVFTYYVEKQVKSPHLIFFDFPDKWNFRVVVGTSQ